MTYVPTHRRGLYRVKKRDKDMQAEYLEKYQYKMTYTEFTQMKERHEMMKRVGKLAKKCKNSFR